MIRNLKYAIIADIGNFNPLFYDEHIKKELAQICREKGITYLPNRSRKSAYKLVNNEFVEAAKACGAKPSRKSISWYVFINSKR